MPPWSPSSWRAHPAVQQPPYDDPTQLERTLSDLRDLPPLVFSGEIEALRAQLADAAEGRRFVLQGGDCAERFRDVRRDVVVRKLKILLQMSLVLTYGARKPVVRLGRFAGQYGKPRSRDTERVGEHELPAYRGDNVNGPEPTPEGRRPDPGRLVEGYFHAAATLNFVRALVDGGFADLHHPEHWQLDFLAASPERAAFQTIADRIRDAIEFLEQLGGLERSRLERVEFYTSHEGLILPYEEALTTIPPRRDRFYNLSAHFLWIGDRTRQLDGAHVEYFRGLANPIGVKVGPTCSPDDLRRLVERLDPGRVPGRLTLITRYGAGAVEKHLPGHLRALRDTGHRPVWTADPMHGNGMMTSRGRKTRSFDAILAELRSCFEIHEAEGTHLGGVHFELTGEDVTECVGGVLGLGEDDLDRNYDTGCDPRLNYAQSMEMAFLIADLFRAAAPGAGPRSFAPPAR